MENFRRIIGGISWSSLSIPRVKFSDVLDILIISFLIYKVLIWIKETRAWSLLKGLGIILCVFFLSSVLNLRTMYWIIVNSFNVGLIAVLVLFQPEIRKVLEEIGRSNINKFFATSRQDNVIMSNVTMAEIIKAAVLLSKNRTGALIVIERSVALGDLEKTGIQLDAYVTSQLIINIFQDKTPLHDGAVIIRNNRIAAATCILPLTQTEIGRELGTRHRAAVGASEVSDANVIVVSEETGSVSIASGGKLFRNMTEEEINKKLSEDIKPQKKKLFLIRRT